MTDYIYTTNDDGMWRSPDNGFTWGLYQPSDAYLARQAAAAAQLDDIAPTIDDAAEATPNDPTDEPS